MFRPLKKDTDNSDEFIDLEAAMPTEVNPAPVDYWQDMPDEMLLAVMQHLSPNDIQQLAKTSRRFHGLSIECMQGTEGKFREWRIGLFRKQQVSLNDDIDHKNEQKYGCLKVSLTIAVGSLMTAMASYANFNEATTTRNPSRDEKVFFAFFLVVSVIVLLVGVGRAIYNGHLSYSISKDSQKISHLQARISEEAAEIRKTQISEEAARQHMHRT